MSKFAEYESYDGVGLAELVVKGEVTSGELLEAAMERADRSNAMLNAVIRPMYDEANYAIEQGLSEGPLSGVPFLLKDLGALCKGVVTSFGSKLFSDFVPDHDSELVARYRRSGLLVCGKTNTSEFGLSCVTEPRQYGPSRNPWDTDRTPGGSSGGSAAAVAAGIVPMAHATDGGGSIRMPASCCGLFGLKPTRARTPMGPDSGERNAGLFVQHAITRSVRDSATLLDIASGPDIGDPYWAPPAKERFAKTIESPSERLLIAVQTSLDGVAVHRDCTRAVEVAAETCAAVGHTVEEASPRYSFDTLAEVTRVIWSANLAALITRRYEALARKPKQGDVEPFTSAFARTGARVSAEQYVRAVDTIHALTRAVARFFCKFDVLITPVLTAPPVPVADISTMTDDADAFWAKQLSYMAFPPLQNATGQPAMSVPLFWNEQGLPIGVQFVGRFGDEATLLRLARQLEEACPWFHRRPPTLADGRDV